MGTQSYSTAVDTCDHVRLSALKSTTLITKAMRLPLVDLTPCVIDLMQEE